jgi:hypothetical protein
MNVRHIDIGRDFARYLGPRLRRDGRDSGEAFRIDILEPAFRENDLVIVAFDSIVGYSASFMEEAFGGLVRKYGYDAVHLKLKFDAVARAYLVPVIEAWMREAGDPNGAER